MNCYFDYVGGARLRQRFFPVRGSTFLDHFRQRPLFFFFLDLPLFGFQPCLRRVAQAFFAAALLADFVFAGNFVLHYNNIAVFRGVEARRNKENGYNIF